LLIRYQGHHGYLNDIPYLLFDNYQLLTTNSSNQDKWDALYNNVSACRFALWTEADYRYGVNHYDNCLHIEVLYYQCKNILRWIESTTAKYSEIFSWQMKQKHTD
jgi:hypothetical protein